MNIISSGLGMNNLRLQARIENELIVMVWFYLAREYGIKNKKYTGSRFSQVQEQTKLSKSTLHGVLKRLIKRGWLIKKEILVSSHPFKEKPTKEEWVSTILKEINSRVESQPILSRSDKITKKQFNKIKKSVFDNYKPREAIHYSLKYFPYIDKSDKLPTKNKRFWKKEANRLKESVKFFEKNGWQPARPVFHF